MATIEELFYKGTGRRSNKWHHYLEVYDRFFGKFVGAPVTYLEVGIDKGGSLMIMRDFLGPQARIIGADLNPECASLRDEGFEIHIGSQSDAQFISQIAESCGPFDMIVDDGGHVADQQLVTFLTLFPKLKYGGVYVVEDLHTCFWHGYQDSRFGINFYDFAKGLVEKMTLWHVDSQVSLGRYGVPPDKRDGQVKINNFAVNDIFGISFFDSMVVFEKRRIPEPYNAVR